MLWLYIFLWVLGASVIIAAFALGVGVRKFGLAVTLFVVGIVMIGASVVAGNRHNAAVHGIRPDAAPEMSTPGGR